MAEQSNERCQNGGQSPSNGFDFRVTTEARRGLADDSPVSSQESGYFRELLVRAARWVYWKTNAYRNDPQFDSSLAVAVGTLFGGPSTEKLS